MKIQSLKPRIDRVPGASQRVESLAAPDKCVQGCSLFRPAIFAMIVVSMATRPATANPGVPIQMVRTEAITAVESLPDNDQFLEDVSQALIEIQNIDGEILPQPGPIPPPPVSEADLPMGPSNVVILVNANSPAGLEIVRLYRRFYPQITNEQIVYLTGLPDGASPLSTPADEITTRADFETFIAQPTRDHLIAHGIVDRTFVIITTAGMPYRIEDTNPAFAAVIQPAWTNAPMVVDNRSAVDAATVESELALLFQIDPALPDGTRPELRSRVVNPYQGYRSSIKRWADHRDILNERHTLRWTFPWRIFKPPFIEGEFSSGGYSANNRRLNPGSIYLTARLDGPRDQGQFPVFSVWEMLKRSAAVSLPDYEGFVGYAPMQSAVAIDNSDDPLAAFNFAEVYNLPDPVHWVKFEDFQHPPGAESFSGGWTFGDHFANGFRWLTGSDPHATLFSGGPFSFGLGGRVYHDPSGFVMNQLWLPPGVRLTGLLTFGKNANDGRSSTYLYDAGPNGGPLFDCAFGAFFYSYESFNALTMFTDASLPQGKIVDFIAIGGSAAVGHGFEPEGSAAVQGDYTLTNYLRDADGDDVGDLCMVESVFAGIPYLSWSEVFIGDPLMRLHVGPGGSVETTENPGDIDGDGAVAYSDLLAVLSAYETTLSGEGYEIEADLTEDGLIGIDDLLEVYDHYGTVYD